MNTKSIENQKLAPFPSIPLTFVKNANMSVLQKNASNNLSEKIKAEVKGLDPAAEVILFGSRARGEAHEDSDWDMLILTERPVTLKVEQAFRHKLFELELEFGQPISVFVYSKADWNGKHRSTPLYHNIQAEGIVL